MSKIENSRVVNHDNETNDYALAYSALQKYYNDRDWLKTKFTKGHFARRVLKTIEDVISYIDFSRKKDCSKTQDLAISLLDLIKENRIFYKNASRKTLYKGKSLISHIIKIEKKVSKMRYFESHMLSQAFTLVSLGKAISTAIVDTYGNILCKSEVRESVNSLFDKSKLKYYGITEDHIERLATLVHLSVQKDVSIDNLVDNVLENFDSVTIRSLVSLIKKVRTSFSCSVNVGKQDLHYLSIDEKGNIAKVEKYDSRFITGALLDAKDEPVKYLQDNVAHGEEVNTKIIHFKAAKKDLAERLYVTNIVNQDVAKKLNVYKLVKNTLNENEKGPRLVNIYDSKDCIVLSTKNAKLGEDLDGSCFVKEFKGELKDQFITYTHFYCTGDDMKSEDGFFGEMYTSLPDAEIFRIYDIVTCGRFSAAVERMKKQGGAIISVKEILDELLRIQQFITSTQTIVSDVNIVMLSFALNPDGIGTNDGSSHMSEEFVAYLNSLGLKLSSGYLFRGASTKTFQIVCQNDTLVALIAAAQRTAFELLKSGESLNKPLQLIARSVKARKNFLGKDAGIVDYDVVYTFSLQDGKLVTTKEKRVNYEYSIEQFNYGFNTDQKAGVVGDIGRLNVASEDSINEVVYFEDLFDDIKNELGSVDIILDSDSVKLDDTLNPEFNLEFVKAVKSYSLKKNTSYQVLEKLVHTMEYEKSKKIKDLIINNAEQALNDKSTRLHETFNLVDQISKDFDGASKKKKTEVEFLDIVESLKDGKTPLDNVFATLSNVLDPFRCGYMVWTKDQIKDIIKSSDLLDDEDAESFEDAEDVLDSEETTEIVIAVSNDIYYLLKPYINKYGNVFTITRFPSADYRNAVSVRIISAKELADRVDELSNVNKIFESIKKDFNVKSPIKLKSVIKASISGAKAALRHNGFAFIPVDKALLQVLAGADLDSDTIAIFMSFAYNYAFSKYQKENGIQVIDVIQPEKNSGYDGSSVLKHFKFAKDLASSLTNYDNASSYFFKIVRSVSHNSMIETGVAKLTYQHGLISTVGGYFKIGSQLIDKYFKASDEEKAEILNGEDIVNLKNAAIYLSKFIDLNQSFAQTSKININDLQLMKSCTKVSAYGYKYNEITIDTDTFSNSLKAIRSVVNPFNEEILSADGEQFLSAIKDVMDGAIRYCETILICLLWYQGTALDTGKKLFKLPAFSTLLFPKDEYEVDEDGIRNLVFSAHFHTKDLAKVKQEYDKETKDSILSIVKNKENAKLTFTGSIITEIISRVGSEELIESVFNARANEIGVSVFQRLVDGDNGIGAKKLAVGINIVSEVFSSLAVYKHYKAQDQINSNDNTGDDQSFKGMNSVMKKGLYTVVNSVLTAKTKATLQEKVAAIYSVSMAKTIGLGVDKVYVRDNLSNHGASTSKFMHNVLENDMLYITKASNSKTATMSVILDNTSYPVGKGYEIVDGVLVDFGVKVGPNDLNVTNAEIKEERYGEMGEIVEKVLVVPAEDRRRAAKNFDIRISELLDGETEEEALARIQNKATLYDALSKDVTEKTKISDILSTGVRLAKGTINKDENYVETAIVLHYREEKDRNGNVMPPRKSRVVFVAGNLEAKK